MSFPFHLSYKTCFYALLMIKMSLAILPSNHNLYSSIVDTSYASHSRNLLYTYNSADNDDSYIDTDTANADIDTDTDTANADIDDDTFIEDDTDYAEKDSDVVLDGPLPINNVLGNDYHLVVDNFDSDVNKKSPKDVDNKQPPTNTPSTWNLMEIIEVIAVVVIGFTFVSCVIHRCYRTMLTDKLHDYRTHINMSDSETELNFNSRITGIGGGCEKNMEIIGDMDLYGNLRVIGGRHLFDDDEYDDSDVEIDSVVVSNV